MLFQTFESTRSGHKALVEAFKKGYQSTFINSERMYSSELERLKRELAMHKIVFVTGNEDKFVEVRDILNIFGIEVIQDKNGYPELQEDELEPICDLWSATCCE